MKVKDFYLIDSLNISGLGESQKAILDDYLNTYHNSSSVSDKVLAIDALVKNKNFVRFRNEYNRWLFEFVTKQLKTSATEKETQILKTVLGSSHCQFGHMHRGEENYEQALMNYRQALKIYEQQNDTQGIFDVYNYIGNNYYEQGDMPNSLEYYERAMQLSKYIKDENSLARFYLSIACVQNDRGNFSKALEYLYKALKVFEENNNELYMAVSYRNIGLSLVSQNELDSAVKYFFKSSNFYQKTGSEQFVINNYISIGAIYETQKKNDTALEYYDKAVQLHKKLNLKKEPDVLYRKIGDLYKNQNQPDLALPNYYEALQLCERAGRKFGQASVLVEIGPLEIKNGNIDKARQQINKAFALTKELNYPWLTKKAAMAKVSLAIAEGDYKLAYEMEVLKTQMSNKIHNENNEKEVIKQQFKYEHEKELIKKDFEIEFEKKNAKFIQEQSDILTLKNNELASKNEIINKQVIEMNSLIQQLQESNESLKQFASVAAHDLKAPLRNIQGFSQILHRKYADKFPEEDMEFFMFIINSCKSLKELIDGLLNYSKISNMEYQSHCVDLAEIVSHVKNNLTNIIKETGVTLHISDNLPKVLGQGSLLFQVFLNFINNAIKFRRIEEGLQSSIWINAEYYDDDHIKISIKDNGIGIAQEYQEEIFGIFRKLHSSSKYEGSGIGLSVCKKIIERFGGQIWVESVKDVGTTFFFTLKCYHHAPEEIQLVNTI